jgi:Class II Aldolase and Adducin N-terminal domain
VKIDLEGRPVAPTEHSVNPAGFIIHSAIHAAREDAHCIMHVHTTAGIAVAGKAAGLSHDNFYGAQFFDRVAYHAFEGISVHTEEQPRLVRSLGAKDVLILRNHGLLVIGTDVPTAFRWLWTLQRACEVQCQARRSPAQTSRCRVKYSGTPPTMPSISPPVRPRACCSMPWCAACTPSAAGPGRQTDFARSSCRKRHWRITPPRLVVACCNLFARAPLVSARNAPGVRR